MQKFKNGKIYKGKLINGSKEVNYEFKYIQHPARDGLFELVKMDKQLGTYKVGNSYDLVTSSDEEDCYWDFKEKFSSKLENK